MVLRGLGQAAWGGSTLPRPLALQAYFRYQKLMSASTEHVKRKVGRPKHPTVQVLVRFEPAEVERVDRWRLHRTGEPSRPEAIRRLVELGLKGKR
jgi:hypothetical protein